MVNRSHCHIEILNPINYKGWDDLLVSSPNCTFFHTSAWAKVLSETYGYKPFYFVFFDSDRLIAVIPLMEVRSIFTGNRGVSLPFTDHCEPLTTEEFQIQETLDFIKRHAREHNWKFIEIRWGHYSDIVPAATFYKHTLDLTCGVQQIFYRFRYSTKTNIKKAVRQGVEVKICRSAEAVNEYYRLHCITRKRHALPPQPYRFFNKIYEHIISKGYGFVVLASHNKMIIAGSVFFDFNGKCCFKFAASDYAYQHLRANNLATWEAIKWYAENGYRSMCFGRTEMNNIGLRRFKAGWGTDEEVINYYRYNLKLDAFMAGRPFAMKKCYCRIFRAAPIPLLRAFGLLLYKHFG